ncbi:uncharacterized protein OCT59_015669 [Rhizophagus irregularis]|uniref:uncharacterized protein n=1 Tax=Rhizophagus irregularis TaxID=588596 RepID=UPI0019E76D65|nr:hypothetical protein OCT59_015669 [Rhizophagus irregularis]GBC49379.2 hypothetical protein GLOIN_2v1792113 [Rhizophagus irregularis DAOM 181602=DAOM 197198]
MRGRRPFKIKKISLRRLSTTNLTSYNHHQTNSMSPHRRHRYRSRRNKSRRSSYSNYSDSRSPSQQRGRSTTRHNRTNYSDSRSPSQQGGCSTTRYNRNDDIEALSRAITALTEEVRTLKKSQTRNDLQAEWPSTPQTTPVPRSKQNTSLTPEPETGYRRRARVLLEDMDEDQYKLFHDEVVQILSGLDDSLQLDHTKKWVEIAPHVSKHIMKEIARVLTGRFQYKDIELKWVLQNLHRHRRESWMVSLDPDKTRFEKKRKGTNSRRKDKKERRQKGIEHMFNINDASLKEFQPSSLSWEEFKEDCETIFNEGGFHSDEVSETDEELTKKEIEDHVRPKNKIETDKHVLHVYDKPWRSRRGRKLLRLADRVGEKISHVKLSRHRWYDDKTWIDESKPPEGAPDWSISQSYGSDVQPQDEIDNIDNINDEPNELDEQV